MARKLKLDMPTTGAKISALDTYENLQSKLKCSDEELEKLKSGEEHVVMKYALKIAAAYETGFESFIFFDGEF